LGSLEHNLQPKMKPGFVDEWNQALAPHTVVSPALKKRLFGCHAERDNIGFPPLKHYFLSCAPKCSHSHPHSFKNYQQTNNWEKTKRVFCLPFRTCLRLAFNNWSKYCLRIVCHTNWELFCLRKKRSFYCLGALCQNSNWIQDGSQCTRWLRQEAAPPQPANTCQRLTLISFEHAGSCCRHTDEMLIIRHHSTLATFHANDTMRKWDWWTYRKYYWWAMVIFC
jgi:hypothetical protein